MNERSAIADKISGAGWGLFLVWLGASFFLKWPPAVGLRGIGVIILGTQLARRYFELGFELFWVVIGVLFIASSFSKLYGVVLPWEFVFPALLIVAGIGILLSIIKGKNK